MKPRTEPLSDGGSQLMPQFHTGQDDLGKPWVLLSVSSLVWLRN